MFLVIYILIIKVKYIDVFFLKYVCKFMVLKIYVIINICYKLFINDFIEKKDICFNNNNFVESREWSKLFLKIKNIYMCDVIKMC